MSKYAIVLLFTWCTFSLAAQHRENFKKIESARIGLITERLELTPEQAEKFWPIYREYTGKRQELRRELIQARRAAGKDEITEEESKELIDKGLELKEKQLELDKIYSKKLGTVISSKQLLELRRAEEDFRALLLERLDRRREDREKK